MKCKAPESDTAPGRESLWLHPLAALDFTVLFFRFKSAKLGPRRPGHGRVENDTDECSIHVSCFRLTFLYRLENRLSRSDK